MTSFSGLFTYTIINGAIWVVVKVSQNKLIPENYDLKEYWSWRPPGERPWIVRAVLRFIYWTRHRKDRSASFSLSSNDDVVTSDQYRSDTASKGAADIQDMPRVATPEPFRLVY
jgi:AGZA family xanthine/uracil permease-like MFS transporter